MSGPGTVSVSVICKVLSSYCLVYLDTTGRKLFDRVWTRMPAVPGIHRFSVVIQGVLAQYPGHYDRIMLSNPDGCLTASRRMKSRTVPVRLIEAARTGAEMNTRHIAITAVMNNDLLFMLSSLYPFFFNNFDML